MTGQTGKWSLLVLQIVSSIAVAQETPSDFGIFDWIHNSPGGYFNPKQEFRYRVEGDSSTIAGVFAKETIKKGEILVKVPWDLVLKSDDEEEVGQMCCGTVEALAREMKLGPKSQFAAYVEYLNAQPEGQIPSAWSKEGQELFRQLLGGRSPKKTEIPPTEPTEWLEWDWYKDCEADRSDTLAAKAALLVVQRSDDYYMIPGYDMYNHRNGNKYMNTVTETVEGEYHVTRATRAIRPGTEIFISYNHCKDCSGRKWGYGTGEIFRDYGFIEDFPQEYHFSDGEIQFILDEDPDDGKLILKWRGSHKPDTNDWEQILVHLNRQRRRLRGVRNLANFNPNIEKIPDHELNLLWKFYESNIVAMSVAIEATEAEFVHKNHTANSADADPKKKRTHTATRESDVMTIDASHYDPLDWEFDDMDYASPSCDNKEIMNFPDYDLVEALKTNYQQLNFAINPTDGDICMDIEDIIQICSCYRPQYHEFVVHAAARFVDKVKRVIFIGGGDSMLLHEALKYPDVELVVGLELDQVVVRKAFKYFKSSPHFDDPRVEWWFGDATKSLLLLQKEYWQSFDLVLIDLSETVMSMTVTEELDVFDAMGLLLKPDGVMVKNELYMEKFSEVFDYSTQIYYESPIICSQALVMGSNSVNFIEATPKDHNVKSLLYEPLVTSENHLDFLHDFRKNDARAQGKCGDLKIPELPSEQAKAAGIIAIVNAEKTTVPLDGAALAKKFHDVIDEQGFSLSSLPVFDNGSVYAILKEGYIVARLWPDEQYCAFDIQLWGSFHKMKSLQAALVEAVGSTLVSSYRVVVGGMFGSSTWKEDQLMMGPQIVQTRNCEDPPVPTDTTTTAGEMLSLALSESMKLSLSNDVKAVVFCGVKGSGECLAAGLLGSFDDVGSVDKIWTCKGLDEEEVSEEVMLACEAKIAAEVKNLVPVGSKINKINLIVVDSTVPYPMLQVLNSILSNVKDRKWTIKKQNLVLVLSTNPEEEPWRQHFLDRYRKHHWFDPVSKGHVLLKSGSASVGFGLVSAGDKEIAYNLESFKLNLEATFKGLEKDVVVELQTIHGGEFPWIKEFKPKTFLQSDYEEQSDFDHYNGQQALGRQNIFQLVPGAEATNGLDMSSTKLKELLSFGLEAIKFDIRSHHEASDIGDGSVQIMVCKEGSAIAVWDGRDHVDLNLFTYEEMPEGPENFLNAILQFTAGTAAPSLRDDQPRGIGRVLNFPSDVVEKKVATADGDDDEEDDDDEGEEGDDAEDEDEDDS